MSKEGEEDGFRMHTVSTKRAKTYQNLRPIMAHQKTNDLEDIGEVNDAIELDDHLIIDRLKAN